MKVPQSQPHSVQQHCPFTQSASPSADQSSATELQDTCWPALPDLHSGQEMFDADLPAPTLDDLCLPGLLRTSSFPNQAVHATDILSAEQLDGSWDHTGLPNLSTFADMDFDEMIAQAADELHSAQQQQRQQHQHQQHLYHHQQHQQQHYQQHQQQHHGSLSPDNDCNEDALQGKVPRRAARSCPASPAMSPQLCRPRCDMSPPALWLRLDTVQPSQAQQGEVDSTSSQQISSDPDFEPNQPEKSVNTAKQIKVHGAIARKPGITKRKAKKSKQLTVRPQRALTLQLPSNREAADRQEPDTGTEELQHSSSLTHITTDLQLAGQQTPAEHAAALAEGTKLLLASVCMHTSGGQVSPQAQLPATDACQANTAAAATAAATAGPHELRRSSLSSGLSPDAAAAAVAKLAGSSAFMHPGPAQAASPSIAIAEQAAITTNAASQTSNVLTRSKHTQTTVPRTASLDDRHPNSCTTATVATQTVATQTVATQTQPPTQAYSEMCTQTQSETQPHTQLQVLAGNSDSVRTKTKTRQPTVAQYSGHMFRADPPPQPEALGAAAHASPLQPTDNSQTGSPRATADGMAPGHITSPPESLRCGIPTRGQQAKATKHTRSEQLKPEGTGRQAGPSNRPAKLTAASPKYGVHKQPAKPMTTSSAAVKRPQPAGSAHIMSKAERAAAAAAKTLQCIAHSPVAMTRVHPPKTPKPAGHAAPTVFSPTADVNPLLDDIMATAGCRVTRKLVHSVLAAHVPAPAVVTAAVRSPVAAVSLKMTAGVVAKPQHSKNKSSATSEHPSPAFNTASPHASQTRVNRIADQDSTAPWNSIKLPAFSSADVLHSSKQQAPISAQAKTKPASYNASPEPAKAKLHAQKDKADTTAASELTGIPGFQSKAGSSSAAVATEAMMPADGVQAKLQIGKRSATRSAETSHEAAHGSASAALDEGRASPRGIKRQLSDAPLEAPKKGKCLTACGMNPKFLATKHEVMELIGGRQDVFEMELRRRMGNNPDTSKALRRLLKDGELSRTGVGGRSDPFKWTKIIKTQQIT